VKRLGGLSNPEMRAPEAEEKHKSQLPEWLGLRNGGRFLEFWQKDLNGSKGRFLWYFLCARLGKESTNRVQFQIER